MNYMSENKIHLSPQTINNSFKMKKSFLTIAAIALVLSLTSCKETVETEEGSAEVIETPAETTIEAVETPIEEVVDTTGASSDTLVQDNTTTIE